MRLKKEQTNKDHAEDPDYGKKGMFVDDLSFENKRPEDDFLEDLFGTPMKWIPEKSGQCLIGVYKGLRELADQAGKKFQIGIIRSESGEDWSVSGYALVTKILPYYPEGVRIMITYLGEVEVGQPAPIDRKSVV